MLEIHHFGREPLICFLTTKDQTAPNSRIVQTKGMQTNSSYQYQTFVKIGSFKVSSPQHMYTGYSQSNYAPKKLSDWLVTDHLHVH